jgi:hypothetical protein
MTARRVIPLFPAPLAALSPAGRADACADWLAAGAAGMLAETAAVNLLTEHGTWLSRDTFTSRCIDITTGITDVPGLPDGTAAAIRWRTAVSGLHRHGATAPEKAVLQIAASIAAGLRVSLHDTLASLDRATLRAVLRAIAHASSGQCGQDLITPAGPQEPLF